MTTLEVDTNPDYTISMLLLTNNKVDPAEFSRRKDEAFHI